MSATPTNEEAVETPSEDGVGQHLRRVREALNLGRAEVAAGLYLKEDIVKALEEDDRDALPSPVFVQGYIRKYARLLNTPEEPLLEAYSQQIAPHKRNKRQSGPLAGSAIRPEISSSHAIVRLITWVIVLGLIALLVIWWQGDMQWPIGQSDEDQSALTQEAAPESLNAPGLPESSDDIAQNEEGVGQQNFTESAPAEQVALPEPQSEEPISDGSQTEAMLDRSLTSDTPAEVTADETEAATDEVASSQEVESEAEAALDNAMEPSSEADETVEDSAESNVSMADSDAEQTPVDYANSIVIEFSDACWTEIRGFDGSYKLLGNMQKGERRVLGGEPPYTFLLGNSQAATLTVKGERFDIEAHSRGNVARFVLQAEDISNP